MTTITVLNSKGGVGKTTTVLSLATLLAELGVSTLIIDMAPQANATLTLFDETPKKNICDFLTDGEISENELGNYIFPIREDPELDGVRDFLNIIPSSQRLSKIKENLPKDGTALKRAGKNLEQFFDVILIDLDPTLDIVAKTALVFSDSVVIPIEMTLYSFQGSKDLMNFIQDIKDKENPNLSIKGFLPTIFKKGEMDKSILNQFLLYYNKDFIMRTTIRDRRAVSKSISYRLPLPIFDKEDDATLDYMNALYELDVLKRKKKKELADRISELNLKIEAKKSKRRKRRS